MPDLDNQLDVRDDATEPPWPGIKDCDADYYYVSAKVSAEFRAAVKAACPFPFTETPDANFCLHLLQYLLFPTLFQQGTTRIVVPCRTLAVLDGVTWNSNYRAIDRLRLFEARTQIPLNVGPWNYQRGLARTVHPVWPPALAAARREELDRFARSHPRVYFDTAEPCGRSRRAKQERLEFMALRRQQAFLLPDDHPQRPVLDLLNSQSNIVLRKVVFRNLPLARQFVLEMPNGTSTERLSRDWAMAVLDAVSLECQMIYRAVQKTARVYTLGLTLHQLPRQARKLLLAGCTTLDLKAAQLAIAGRVWDVPLLLDRLQGTANHWQMLLEELRIEPEHKPALKTATYAILFGKSVRSRPGHGNQHEDGSGAIYDLAQDLGGDTWASAAAQRFAQHPATMALITARQKRMQRVIDEEGLTTVFGKRIQVPSEPKVRPRTSLHKAELRSALAEELQAYEQALMLPALSLIAKRRGVSVLSYLHDGLTLHFEDQSKKTATIARICKEVSKKAEQLGIPTGMEEE